MSAIGGQSLVIALSYGTPLRKWCDVCQTGAGYCMDIYGMEINGLAHLRNVTGCTVCDIESEGA